MQFSWDCLAQNEWNVERAIANFNQVKVSLRLAMFDPHVSDLGFLVLSGHSR